jgi:hypothetical protein
MDPRRHPLGAFRRDIADVAALPRMTKHKTSQPSSPRRLDDADLVRVTGGGSPPVKAPEINRNLK